MAEVGKRRRNATATRDALVEAARTLLAERGATQTTTRDIAALVGVNQALINRYFGSKENLFIEAVRTGGGGDVARLVETVSPQDLPDAILREVLDVSARGVGGIAMLTGVVNSETINDVIRGIVEDVFTQRLGSRLGADGALRAELMNALVVGITIMRHKIASPALSSATVDEISDYVTRMTEPLISDPVRQGDSE